MHAAFLVALLLGAEGSSAAPPWKTNPPIVAVKKELYLKHTRERTAAVVSVGYVGPNLELLESRGTETKDDVLDDHKFRWSTDNGRTWSKFVKGAASNNIDYGGITVWEGGVCRAYDPSSRRLVEMWLRQIQVGLVVNNFTYIRTSQDLGRTWTEPVQLTYEPGDSFDPRQPLKPTFLRPNQGMPGSSIRVRHDGALVCCLGHANAAQDPQNDHRAWKLGSVCFIGQWDKKANVHHWTPGQRVEVSPDISSRGLMEPELAELNDHRLLVVWRGSSTLSTAGRKWFSISHDGGKTLSPPAEWKYSDGSRFYSPSSYHRMIRHSVSGKLYWVGNICAQPPSGNSPRYPLVIGEVNQATAALKRESITLIDDRAPDQSPAVQFSNFSLIENRPTRNLEMHLTLYGQDPDPKNWASADNFKYTLTLK